MEQLFDFQNKNLSFEERTKDLVSQMTLEEKIGQMQHGAPAIERLGIPDYNWWSEALHGVARAGVATMFPQAIGLAASFDAELLGEVAEIIAVEGRAKYHEFLRQGDHDIFKGLTFWSPTINIDRDPRWGRGQETYGEDPYLTARLAVSFIRGLQGNDETYYNVSACAKHFAGHSGPEDERHAFDAQITPKDLWETYLPAFEAAVKEAKVSGVMGAYNRLNGEPCCGSKTLLKDILRDEWGFKGYVTSDCWAIRDFHESHKVTTYVEESAALAVSNGCDLNCGCAYASLIKAVQKGLLEEKQIDEAVYRLMLIRMRLGMFDLSEKVPYSNIPYEKVDCEEHRKAAQKAAEKTLVLLKNKGNILPLKKESLHRIAVIGPNADSRKALEGNYCGTPSNPITALEGIRHAVVPGTRIFYAQGCPLYKNSTSSLAEKYDRIAEAVSAAEHAELAIVCLGLDSSLEGEQGDTGNEYSSGDKPNLDLPGTQQELLEAVQKTGTPVVLVLFSGSALAVNWAQEHVDAIVQAWYPGEEGGNALASVLFGEVSPSARLPVTFYRSEKDLPDFHDYSMKNRTYRHLKTEPLYPFGYGLSYTQFEYSKPSCSKDAIPAGKSVQITVQVKNVGACASDEIVQLYLQDCEASVRVPRWQLAGIKRIPLQAGAQAQLCFTIAPRQMALITEEGKCILEPGRFRVYVGGSQPDDRSTALTGRPVLFTEFEVTGHVLLMQR